MTAPVPVPDGTTPPAEAIEAVMEALGCSATATAWADREEARRVVVCAAHRDEWIDAGCPVAERITAAVVAALDLPKRDRETAAKAWDEVFEVIERSSGHRVMEHVHLTAMDALDWLERAVPEKDHRKYRVQSVAVYAAAALREGRES